MPNRCHRSAAVSARFAPPPRTNLPGLLSRAFRGLWAVLLAWQARADQRHQLASLSDHHLEDMGLTREAARRESAKPFWMPMGRQG